MICYRVVRRKFAGLSGEGARRYGGRFNPPGVSAIYSSQSIALALLEVLVHVDKSEVPNDYFVMAIQIEGRSVYRPRNVDLLRTSYNRPVIRVPSVIVPREYNYVLYPEAEGFEASIAWTEPLNFDSRLFAFAGE
jgi:RES domain-containing protein